MSAVFEEVVITWGVDEEGNAQEWRVTPTYEMAQRIESFLGRKHGTSIAGVSSLISTGSPPVYIMADIVASLLRGAGCNDVTGEDVAVDLFHMSPDQFASLCATVLSGFIPQKKSGSPPVKPKKKAAKKKRT